MNIFKCTKTNKQKDNKICQFLKGMKQFSFEISLRKLWKILKKKLFKNLYKISVTEEDKICATSFN